MTHARSAVEAAVIQHHATTPAHTKEVTIMDKVLLTPNEAAEALSIGRSKLYGLLAEGALHSVHIGSCRRVPLAAVMAYVQRLEADETEAGGSTAA